MAGELLTGLIEIAVGIAAGPSPIWYILKGERSTINEIQTQMKTDMENIRSEMCATNNPLEQIVHSTRKYPCSDMEREIGYNRGCLQKFS